MWIPNSIPRDTFTAPWYTGFDNVQNDRNMKFISDKKKIFILTGIRTKTPQSCERQGYLAVNNTGTVRRKRK